MGLDADSSFVTIIWGKLSEVVLAKQDGVNGEEANYQAYPDLGVVHLAQFHAHLKVQFHERDQVFTEL